jgi:hypothetical protein
MIQNNKNELLRLRLGASRKKYRAQSQAMRIQPLGNRQSLTLFLALLPSRLHAGKVSSFLGKQHVTRTDSKFYDCKLLIYPKQIAYSFRRRVQQLGREVRQSYSPTHRETGAWNETMADGNKRGTTSDDRQLT